MLQSLRPALRGLLLPAVMSLTAARAHVHIQVGYASGQWDLYVLDFESGRFAPGEAPLRVALTARQPVPADPHYTTFLGAAGDGVWILPESEAPGLLHLGLGTSGIGSNVFNGNLLHLELHRLEGPGHLAMFTMSPFGAPMVYFASLDGVNPATDFFPLPAVNGHLHVNWAFTAPGVYRLGLAAAGTVAATGRPSTSPIVDYTFIVEGPPAPLLKAPRVLADGSVNFLLIASAGSRVQIQTATEIGRWETLGELTAEEAPIPVTLPVSAKPQRFFRAVCP